jgi:spore coat polysaccharide biosynthesis protein SpsF
VNAVQHVVAIVQARMGSQRLPGKTLADIGGKPLLAHVVDRCEATESIDRVILATTSNAEDAALLRWAESRALQAFAGDPEDVLNRFYHVASQSRVDVIVRVTADDPFKDPALMDEMICSFKSLRDLDYMSNVLDPTYPEGLDTEIFTPAALKRAWEEATLASEREHVTPYIWKHPDSFRLYSYKLDRDLSHLRWTIDYPEDLEFARAVVEHLDDSAMFGMTEILELIESEPWLGRINSRFERGDGYRESLINDKIPTPNIGTKR